MTDLPTLADLDALKEKIAKCPPEQRRALQDRLDEITRSLQAAERPYRSSEVDDEVEAQFDNMPV